MTGKRLISAMFCGFGFVTLSIGAASAASPAYCALYAREYANAKITGPVAGDAAGALQRLQDQAYYRCLNMDEDPEFPTTSAYFGKAVDEVTGSIGGPLESIASDTATGDAAEAAPAEIAAPPKPKPTQTANAQGLKAGSGLKAWSPEWVTWCKAHYRSFNLTTGFILTLSGERKLCP